MDRKSEDGFTLIELMIVLGIIGILISIALPTFLGARNRADDKVAQWSLRVTLENARTGTTQNNTFIGVDAAELTTMETAVSFVDNPTPSAGPKDVSVDAISSSEFRAAALSNSGTCFLIKDSTSVGGGTLYGSFTPTGSSPCKARGLVTWASSW
jgi:type IV pilus assembly protein PilA